MAQLSPRDRFSQALQTAVVEESLVKLTLGKYRGSDVTLKNIFVRPVSLKAGPHWCFVWRHATQDLTKNLPPAEALTVIEQLLGQDFLDAHLFTRSHNVQFETAANGRPRIKFMIPVATPIAPPAHDQRKSRLIDPHAAWLRDLGVTNEHGQPCAGLAPKFRQIQKFAETLSHLLTTAELTPHLPMIAPRPLRVADMGAGKGYLTFAAAALLGPSALVIGVERRPELVAAGNRLAQKHQLSQLQFQAGDIAATADTLGLLDVLIALHACDTATDDALAAGINAGASLLVVSPCCQKELRPQLTPPPVLAPALRHGIFQERHTEFVTDALRALLLEAHGFETKVFEFISTEHTARNLMLAAWKTPGAVPKTDPVALQRACAFAAHYSIKTHALARHLRVDLEAQP